ncbi:hypothetical protein ABT56_18760 [Photobacterium aquae]|uniref:Conjugal transfer protein TraL n=1 Tax=Photobacterium aquae TaxID=1195763 RepID=A0A0J1GV27_9GAMM|nr:type IV conjugative transfer system protein TraL [Photobacterium aquae]KLV03481.1 hypothetical protein ABT56_18760 [Photobacterium aquae]
MNEDIDIPDMIEEPSHILFWQWDVILPIGVFVMIGILFNFAFTGLIMGVLMSRQYCKIRDNKPKGYFSHWIYSLGFMTESEKMKSVVNPNINRFD